MKTNLKFISSLLFSVFFVFTSLALAQRNASEITPDLLKKAAEVLDKKVEAPGSKGSVLLINQFATGVSSTETEFLNSESFAPVETQRLKNARIAWLNYDLLRDLGFDVPQDGLTPELEKALLDAFAYVVPNERISSDKFLPTKKTFYADRYGGSGTGYAEGSGRAAAAGMFQIKGIGRTPLAEELRKTKEPIITWNPKSWSPFEIYKRIKSELSEIHHSHGGATLREGLAEAIWGEVLQRELPFGSNRVLAVIMTDLSIGAFGESRALIVRENSLRPAHFIRTEKGKDFFSEKEHERMTKLGEKLKSFILNFVPQDYGNEGERFILGQKVLIHRVTKKFAVEYAHSVFPGSTSPSNIDLRGTALDLGPMTALQGFEKALFADDYPNGDVRNIKETILFEFFDDLKVTLPASLKKSVLNRQQVNSAVKTVFEENVNRELLWFAGVPRELLEKIWEHAESRDFAENLRHLIKAGNDQLLNVRFKVKSNQTKYDVRKILKILSSRSQMTPEEFLLNLEEEIPSTRVRNKLIGSFNKFQNVPLTTALKDGFSELGFLKYQSAAAEIRNQKMTSLMRGVKYFMQFFSEIWKYKIMNNRTTLFNFVNRIIEQNRRYWFNSAPKSLVIAEKKHHESGAVLQMILDGKTGKERVELSAPVNKETVSFFGEKISLKSLKKGMLNLLLGKSTLPISSVTLHPNQVAISFGDGNLPLNLKNLDSYAQVSFVKTKAENKIQVDFSSALAQEQLALDRSLTKQIEALEIQEQLSLTTPVGLSCQQVFLAQ